MYDGSDLVGGKLTGVDFIFSKDREKTDNIHRNK